MAANADTDARTMPITALLHIEHIESSARAIKDDTSVDMSTLWTTDAHVDVAQLQAGIDAYLQAIYDFQVAIEVYVNNIVHHRTTGRDTHATGTCTHDARRCHVTTSCQGLRGAGGLHAPSLH